MRRIYLLVLALVLGFGLTACGGDSTGADSAGPGSVSPAAAHHNDADVMFAQMMIPHHQQAIEMANLATTRAQSPDVKALAARISGAQAPEIQTMTGWLTSWGQSTSMAMDHGSGMMSQDDMSKLMAATGSEFDRMFLTMMTDHHNSVISMGQDEQRSGQYEPAKQLASQIVTSQQAEVGTMQNLLAKV